MKHETKTQKSSEKVAKFLEENQLHKKKPHISEAFA